MKLSAYMELKNLTDAKLAEDVGRERSNITRWRLGRTRPDWEAIAKLTELTNGAVTAQDFVSIPGKEVAA